MFTVVTEGLTESYCRKALFYDPQLRVRASCA